MKYGFLGCGNMGGALVKALSKVTKDITVTDRSGKAKSLADSLGIHYGTAEEIAASCDRICSNPCSRRCSSAGPF